MQIFDKFWKAFETARLFNELNYPTIPKVLVLLYKKTKFGLAIVVDKIYPTRLQEWLTHESGKRLLCMDQGDQFLEMEPNHYWVFSGPDSGSSIRAVCMDPGRPRQPNGQRPLVTKRVAQPQASRAGQSVGTDLERSRIAGSVTH